MKSLEPLKSTPVKDNLPPDEIAVGLLASITLHHTAVFLVSQLLIIVLLNIPMLLFPAWGWYSEKTGGVVALTIFGVVNLTFLSLLALDGRKRYRHAITIGDPRLDVITETRLEAAGGTIAAAMFVASFLYGMSSYGLKIMLVVAEGAALLFMLVFSVTRFALTKKVRWSGVAVLLALAVTLWRLVGM